MKKTLALAAFITSFAGIGLVSAQEDLNDKLRSMVTGYLALDCRKSDDTLQELDRDDLNAAMGILDLRVKCYADSDEYEKADAVMQAFERAYPKEFPTVSARYYLELKRSDADKQDAARKDVIGAHAAEGFKDAEGDHLFLRERVRQDNFLVEIREDLSFLKNGLYGRRYQYRVLEDMSPIYTVILGSSRVVEDEIKKTLELEQGDDTRFFHLDYFGDDGEIGPMEVYTVLPAYESAKQSVLAMLGKAPTLLKNHGVAAKQQLPEIK